MRHSSDPCDWRILESERKLGGNLGEKFREVIGGKKDTVNGGIKRIREIWREFREFREFLGMGKRI